MITLISTSARKGFDVKLTLKKNADRSQLEEIFRDIIRIEHYRVVEEEYTGKKRKSSIEPRMILSMAPAQPQELPYEELGILERTPQIGFYVHPGSTFNDFVYRYYEKSVSKYIGSLRLLAEVLHGFSQISQDLSLMIPKYETDGAEHVAELLAGDNIWHNKDILELDYPDLVLFMKICKDLSFADIHGVCGIDGIKKETEEEKEAIIELGKRNANVLRLTRNLPDYIEE